jgi:excisionase family DNA binding protein
MSLEHSPTRDRKSAAATRVLPLLLRIEDAARELSATPRYIYELVHAGLLDLVRIGPKSTRITSASVLRLASEHTKPNPPPVNLRKSREQEPSAAQRGGRLR